MVHVKIITPTVLLGYLLVPFVQEIRLRILGFQCLQLLAACFLAYFLSQDSSVALAYMTSLG